MEIKRLKNLNTTYRGATRYILPICLFFGLLIGTYFSTVSLMKIFPVFYEKNMEKCTIALQEDVDAHIQVISDIIDKKQFKKEKKMLKPERRSSMGGKTGGDGDPRARVTKKGVLGIVSGGSAANSAPLGKGGYATGMDNVIAGVGGLKKDSESGFGGGSSVNLNKRGKLRVVQPATSSLSPKPMKELTDKRSESPRESKVESDEDIRDIQYKPTYFNEKTRTPAKENPFIFTYSNPTSTFSIDVDDASYTNIKRSVEQNILPAPQNVRIEEMLNYFSYSYPKPSGSNPFSITTETASCPWNPSNRLVHIGLRGRGLPGNTLPPSNFVFLVDVSGSMNREERLPLVKESLRLILSQLRHKDRIAIISYSEKANMVIDATPGDQKEIINSAINELNASGSTAGNDGLALAYRIANHNFIDGGNNRVILATDGNFNMGATGKNALIAEIEKRRSHGIFLTLFGFGISDEDETTMEQLANKGDGNFSIITSIEDAQKVCVDEMKGTFFAVGKDVKIQAEFNRKKVSSYRLIGYENRMLKKRDFNDDTKDAGEIGAEQSVTALYEVVPESPILSSTKLLDLKLRYKDGNGEASKLITNSIFDNGKSISASSDDFRFSAAVAQLGMQLRLSQYSHEITYDGTLQLALSSLGTDRDGYRREFCNLVIMCSKIDGKDKVSANNAPIQNRNYKN